jgi:hypothetical protein
MIAARISRNMREDLRAGTSAMLVPSESLS